MCSQTVFALLSMIKAIPPYWSFYPYFTVQHSHFKKLQNFKKLKKYKPLLIGVTNPYFLKHLSWYHVLSCGKNEEQKKSSKNSKNIRKVSGVKSISVRDELMWEYQEILITSKDLKKKFVIRNDYKPKFKKENSLERNNEILMHFFYKLTQVFLYPLELCFKEIKSSINYFFLQREIEKNFSPKKFYQYILKHENYKEKIFRIRMFKKKPVKSEILDFYRKFIFSLNFKSWVRHRIKTEYFRELGKLNIRKLVSSFNEIKLMDMFIRLNEDILYQKKNRHVIDGKIVEKLTDSLNEIIKLSPPCLRRPMEFHMKKLENNK